MVTNEQRSSSFIDFTLYSSKAFNDNRYDRLIRKGARVAKNAKDGFSVVCVLKLDFLRGDFPQNSSHNLTRSCFGQIRDDYNSLGGCKGANLCSDLAEERLSDIIVTFRLERAEANDGLPM